FALLNMSANDPKRTLVDLDYAGGSNRASCYLDGSSRRHGNEIGVGSPNVRKYERRHQGEISEDRACRGGRNLLAGLSVVPHLAVWMALAWRGGLLLPADDLRRLCGAGPLFDRRGN